MTRRFLPRLALLALIAPIPFLSSCDAAATIAIILADILTGVQIALPILVATGALLTPPRPALTPSLKIYLVNVTSVVTTASQLLAADAPMSDRNKALVIADAIDAITPPDPALLTDPQAAQVVYLQGRLAALKAKTISSRMPLIHPHPLRLSAKDLSSLSDLSARAHALTQRLNAASTK